MRTLALQNSCIASLFIHHWCSFDPHLQTNQSLSKILTTMSGGRKRKARSPGCLAISSCSRNKGTAGSSGSHKKGRHTTTPNSTSYSGIERASLSRTRRGHTEAPHVLPQILLDSRVWSVRNTTCLSLGLSPTINQNVVCSNCKDFFCIKLKGILENHAKIKRTTKFICEEPWKYEGV